eukprot:940310_1
MSRTIINMRRRNCSLNPNEENAPSQMAKSHYLNPHGIQIRPLPNRFNLLVFVFLMWTLNVTVSDAFTVECKDVRECVGDYIQCLDDQDCNVLCSGWRACEQATINCTSVSHPCYVECGAHSCHMATIQSSHADLSVVCGTHVNSSMQQEACKWMNIDASKAQSLVLDVMSSWDVYEANIRCPIDGANNNCLINIAEADDSPPWWPWSMSIYAVNAFRDIDLYSFCPVQTGCDYPTVFCTENFNESCTMQLVNDRWQCDDTNSTCNRFLDFTSAPSLPTSSPTNAPSISPVYAVPYSSDDVLYVRQTGCDHSDCSSDSAQFDIYCRNNDFHNGYFKPCCTQYSSPDPPINETLVPTDCEGSYVSINDTGIYDHAAIGMVRGSGKDWLPLCFYVQTSFICHSPKVDVTFEAIDYPASVEDRYLNIGYQNQSTLLNTNQCQQQHSCGTFDNCPLDAFSHESYLGDPGDGPWLNGFKVFYAINGEGVGYAWTCPYTDTMNVTYDVTMNVRMNVECGQTKQFACKTMNHTLRCLRGEGFGDCDYDGNGAIDIGEGIFDLNQSVTVKHKQIVFQGVSDTSTVLQHTLQNETALIHCEYQCYITIQDLEYSTSNTNSKIEIINGGHMTFQNVLFANNDISFIIDGFANVTFVDCEFRSNDLHQNGFTISNGAYVSFKQCQFKNNSFFADVFTVNSAVLAFDDTSFNHNIASLSTNLVTGNGGSLRFKNCIFYKNSAFNTLLNVDHLDALHVIASLFIANANINRLLYVSNATDISILNTTIDEYNQCHDDHCVSILNSNLSIDQYSLSLQVPHDTSLPTTSPTAPTPEPTNTPTMPTPAPTLPPTLSTNVANITKCGTYCYDVPVYPKIDQQTHSMAHIQISAPFEAITFTVNFHIKNTECIAPSMLFSYEHLIWSEIPSDYSQFEIFNNDDIKVAVCPSKKLGEGDGGTCDEWNTCPIENDDLISTIHANSTYSFTIEQSGQEPGCYKHDFTTNVKFWMICFATYSPTVSPTTPAPTAYIPCGIDTYCYDIPIYPQLEQRTEHVVDIWSAEDGSDMYFDINFIASVHPCTQPRISFEFQENDFDSPESEYLDLFGHDGTQIAHCTGTADYKYNHTIQCLSERSLLVNEFEDYTITVYKPRRVDNQLAFYPFFWNETWYGPYKEENAFSINANLTLYCASNAPEIAQPTEPTNAPTLWPTASKKVLLYGHTEDDQSIAMLELNTFNPLLLLQLIDFTHFGRPNGSVVYSPCVPPDTGYADVDMFFPTLREEMELLAANKDPFATVFASNNVKETLQCNDPMDSTCFMICSSSCTSSTFIANASFISLIECNGTVSCFDTTMYLSSSLKAAVKCTAEDSCKNAAINVDSVFSHFSLECVEIGSCDSAVINITNCPGEVKIRCYSKDACSNINIYSDNDDTKFAFYQFSDNVNLHIPKGLDIKNNLNCDPLDRYVLVDGSSSFNVSVDKYFDESTVLYCSSVWFWFTEIDRVQCEIRYSWTSFVSSLKQYLYDFVSCFADVYLSDIVDYDCYGTFAPTNAPTLTPSLAPTNAPSNAPSFTPTVAPSIAPTNAPSIAPSLTPTGAPSDAPSNAPSIAPSFTPTVAPSNAPSDAPSIAPSFTPTVAPSNAPSDAPSIAPSFTPTRAPSDAPSNAPSIAPSPSDAPSNAPSIAPSLTPTGAPSNAPTNAPTNFPTFTPTGAPSNAPTDAPSNTPSSPPTNAPSTNPSISPSQAPSLNPSIAPTDAPSLSPTRFPTDVDSYPLWIDIKFHLTNLTVFDINQVAVKPVQFLKTFALFVEESLVSTDIFRQLEYQYFEPVFHQINDYEVNVKTNRFDESLTTNNLVQNAELNDQYALTLAASINFNSDTTGSTILLTIQKTTEKFTDYVESKLRVYLNHDGVQCEIVDSSSLEISDPMKADDKTQETILWAVITGLVGLIILWQLAVYIRRKCKETKVSNALVVNCAIGEYVRPLNPEFETEEAIPNLCVDKDVENLYPLFVKLNYNVMGSRMAHKLSEKHTMQLKWSEEQIMELLRDAAREMTANINVYDALFVIFSCHGWEGNIITSDYKLIDKNAIHRLFSIEFPETRTKPRMMIFDCCEGAQRRHGGKGKEAGKQVNVELIKPQDKTDTNLWHHDEVNPDYKLIEIHASNLGFQSLMSSKKGSYLLNGFKDELQQNLFGNKCCRREKNLGEIFASIQNNLHKKGIQQIKKVFNNDTDYLLIRKNEKVKPKASTKDARSTGEQIELQGYKMVPITAPQDETKYQEEEDIRPAVDENKNPSNPKAAQSVSLMEDASVTEKQSILGNNDDDDEDL